MADRVSPNPLTQMTTLKTSVFINGLHIPMKQAIQSVARFCRPLVIYNEGSSYELSFPGSAFAVRIGCKNYLFATLHQLGKGAGARSPGEIVVLDGRVTPIPAITGREVSFEKNLDFFTLEFPEESNGRDLAPLFCRFELGDIFDAPELTPGMKVLSYFAIGFPSGHQDYFVEWDENTETGSLSSATSRWTTIWLKHVDRNVFDREYLQPYQMTEEAAVALGDPDGLSGSPVFLLYQDQAAQVHMWIAGMIQWANKAGRVNALPSFYIREALKLPSTASSQI